jgi:hypothetical protein
MPALPWNQLSSSFLTRCTWDPETEELQLQFASGKTYSFDGVPASVYQGLLEADSPGRYYHANIKDNYG